MDKVLIKNIAHKGASALVEFVREGQLERRVIPLSSIIGDTTTETAIRNGAPYGLSLQDFDFTGMVSDFPKRLEQACRARGLWTREDFTKNPALVQSALQSTLSLDVGSIQAYVDQLE